MKYLLECNQTADSHTGYQETAGTFEDFGPAERLKQALELITGPDTWTIWRIEYHFDGRAEGDRS